MPSDAAAAADVRMPSDAAAAADDDGDDGLPRPRAGLPKSWGDDEHRRRAKASRERLRAQGAQFERLAPRDVPPPPQWFTLVAAIVPALPYAAFASASAIALWFPVWVACFYIVPRPLPLLSPTLVLCIAVTYHVLSSQGWSGFGLAVLTPFLGFLMNLAESAFWDTLEPFLVGRPGFGSGRQVEVPLRHRNGGNVGGGGVGVGGNIDGGGVVGGGGGAGTASAESPAPARTGLLTVLI